jgi:hypothetical protein
VTELIISVAILTAFVVGVFGPDEMCNGFSTYFERRPPLQSGNNGSCECKDDDDDDDNNNNNNTTNPSTKCV